jgi:uncharacterized protein
MATVYDTSAASPRPWGVVMTLVWAVAAIIVALIASVLTMAVWFDNIPADTPNLVEHTRATETLFIVIVIAGPAVLAMAARLAGWRVADYLALTLPARREAAIATAIVVAFAAGLDALTYLLGMDVVSPFQLDLYRKATAEGTLVLMWLMLVVAAPVGEEILFRGFLFRGWAQTQRAVLPAIVAIAALWAVIHTQYDWYGIIQIFLLGLLLGWVRWRSNSTLLTIALHALVNTAATLQTIAKVAWL